jgi:glutamate synthase (NADPH) large chain
MPPPQGLYDPRFEHDACGVGCIASLRNEASHAMLLDGLSILRRLAHRGAAGSDPRTGDGAGVMVGMPDWFLRQRANEVGWDLPAPGDYGCGLVFLPPGDEPRAFCMEWFEETIRREGQRFLGWREVPVRPETIGETARRAQPAIWQLFIGRGDDTPEGPAFDRRLWMIRKIMERTVRESELPQKGYFHVPSLSSRTLVYKGMFLADQLEAFYPDLNDPSLTTAFALVHQRYSTNTFPTWDLAQPFRVLCHNGEINTLRGNANWMRARESLFASPELGPDLARALPALTPGASDSAMFDNAVELLMHAGRALPHAMMMLIPEAWEKHEGMSDAKKAFYEYHACLTEPWDGPAAMPFSDGRYLGAVLDRNGLRPSRYTVTRDGRLILASETGVLDLDPAEVERKGRLEPGRMLLADLEQGRIIEDEELKAELCARRPYRAWLDLHLRRLADLPAPPAREPMDPAERTRAQQTFGYTIEDFNLILPPMAGSGEEPIGSMGTDTPLAVLSDRAHLLYDYFKQFFAQVTNPPLDAIREELVTSMIAYLGPEGNLLAETPEHARRFRVNNPMLSETDMDRIAALDGDGFHARTLPAFFPAGSGGAGLERAMDRLCEDAERAIAEGANLLVLSDRAITEKDVPIPALLACAGVAHHLIRRSLLTRASLIVDSGEPREVHHFALLFGYGAGAIHPRLALETVRALAREGKIEGATERDAGERFLKASIKGVLKVMSKMGISTLRSYRGAQLFEAVGIRREVVDRYFTDTPTRVSGIGMEEIAREAQMRHDRAWPRAAVPAVLTFESPGEYQWRRGGEPRLLDPLAIALLQQAVRQNDAGAYRRYTEAVHGNGLKRCTLRSLLDFDPDAPAVPLEEVEPWTEIVRRFKTGAMSYGSISIEAHETLALAMNRLGGHSNSGEGGEDPERYQPDPRGGWRRSAIKQVASGRFGVTSHYLVNARELQIKIAQGAKPGEGGQLPGFKVYPWIARTRHSTPYVTLISPPPHHDIYSIEDLAQLIHDLKSANPAARVDVKLVSEIGVGTVAAGVAKGKADLVLISGYDGGTGASPLSSTKHAGLPWELGLAETHQTLLLNDLRSRITIECDGKLLTGRDVAIACLLGAEEFGFSAGPIVSMGCIMMRVCHLNTCPVGVATQDPELRKKFAGKPEHVIQYFRFLAEELRGIMAQLGFRTMDEMVGRSDRLVTRAAEDHWKARGLDLSPLLHRPELPEHIGRRRLQAQEHHLDQAADHALIAQAQPALLGGEAVTIEATVRNVDRTFGTMLSSEISRQYGEEGLPDHTITVRARGSGGQSFGAFGARGLTLRLEGETNDYFGKGLSGAQLILRPPGGSRFVAEENIICGNVALYGATSGRVFIRGRAGERFAVRNSGAAAVVEGLGDHGCEYMTGGVVVVIGRTGRNFAAGMSGGVAYVHDPDGSFRAERCNRAMVAFEEIAAGSAEDVELRGLVEAHAAATDSPVATGLLARWPDALGEFTRIMPTDYKRALERMKDEAGMSY